MRIKWVTTFGIVGIFVLIFFFVHREQPNPPIKVGILHSLTGTMAISESGVVDASLLAIDELNRKGGLLGRQIVPVLVDGKSDWPTFAKMAESLIVQENVSTIFGCWTSASRKYVKPVIEKYDHLLWYPVQYEGIEQSPNIIYTGASPNQQIIPAIKWCFDQLGKRYYLVGSDYIFPRTANQIIRDLVSALGGEIAGEDYIPLGSKDVYDTIKNIVNLRPDVVVNTINGDTNLYFFRELFHQNSANGVIPTMSFSITENELKFMDIETIEGHFAAWNYFQSISSKENTNFVQKFKNKYGEDRAIGDPMEAAYFGVHLWAQAVIDANSDAVSEVKKKVKRQSFLAPEGIVYIDPVNQHTWKSVRIGQILGNGQFEVLWNSDRPIRPIPYPEYKSKSEWEIFVKEFLN